MKLGMTARRATVAGLATLTAICLGTSTAWAGSTVSVRTERAGAYFYHFSETLRVSDYKADGYGARANLVWGDHRASVHADGGLNDTDEKNLGIAEGTTAWLQLCYTRHGDNVRCGAVHKGVA